LAYLPPVLHEYANAITDQIKEEKCVEDLKIESPNNKFDAKKESEQKPFIKVSQNEGIVKKSVNYVSDEETIRNETDRVSTSLSNNEINEFTITDTHLNPEPEAEKENKQKTHLKSVILDIEITDQNSSESKDLSKTNEVSDKLHFNF
jgi:hypothetical protein